jgi:hypothetical protein
MFRSTMRAAGMVPVLGLALLVPGCFFDPDIDDVVGVIEQEIAPAEIRPETTVRVGRALMSLARVLAGFVQDEEGRAARKMLQGIEEVHLGVYEVDGLRRSDALQLPESLKEKLHGEGWGMVVSMNTDETQLWLMAQAKRSRIHAAYVIVLERDELVVVKLRGNLSHTLDVAVREALRGNPNMMGPLRDAAGA